jgi:hypothetical protein
MIARNLRERGKQIPVVGPLLHINYLKAFFREGEVLEVKGRPVSWQAIGPASCETLPISA